MKARCQNFKEMAGKIVELQVPNVKIVECQRLAGEWCMMLKVRVNAPEDLTNLIDEMVKHEEVLETSTTFILSTLYEDGWKEF
ncbi:Lrp/AsnC ligand binding domain-containing protein [Brevibacillus nitrificans]|uniref:Lrp/AsnC ligand binding domain-containing protein n=1 Tax=Brevibacillus nitrificans TaxID=651560 RepID=UPI002854C377|nr:Lrp/AsnC ligand binding domain-containing protein [Brevibacillus nitrificans]MDR7317238.1 DNA-binding Lrp family transcriptional regulator [Brevibacillus nitrificans]